MTVTEIIDYHKHQQDICEQVAVGLKADGYKARAEKVKSEGEWHREAAVLLAAQEAATK